MASCGFLQRELAVAGQQLMIALRLNRRLTGQLTDHPEDGALPSAEECRQLIESRSAKYVSALSRYREALEKAIHRRTTAGPRVGARRRNPKRRYAFEVRRPPYSSSLTFPVRKLRRR